MLTNKQVLSAYAVLALVIAVVAHAPSADGGARVHMQGGAKPSKVHELARTFESFTPQLARSGRSSSSKHLTRLDVLDAKGFPAHRASVTIELEAFDSPFTLDLELTSLPDRFTVTHEDENGHIVGSPGVENCYYSGHVNGDAANLAIVSTCFSGLSGWFHHNGDVYILHPVEHEVESMAKLTARKGTTSTHTTLVYRKSDLHEQPIQRCGHESHDHEHTIKDIYSEIQDLSSSHGASSFVPKAASSTPSHTYSAMKVEGGFAPPKSPVLKVEQPPQGPLAAYMPHKVESLDTVSAGNPLLMQCSTPSDPAWASWVPKDSSCQCKDTWSYNGKTFCSKSCGNPDQDANGAWCFTTAKCGGLDYAYCQAATSSCSAQNSKYKDMKPKSAGCTCKDKWSYNGKTFCGGICENPDSDVNGAWCFTSSSCGGKSYDYCAKASDGCSTQRSQYRGLVPSVAGCTCKSSWSYNGKTFCNRKCENPDEDANGGWCFTDGACNGQSYVYCKQPVSAGGGSSNSGGSVSAYSHIVELFVTADQLFYQTQSSSITQVQTYVINAITEVRKRYDLLNLGIGIQLVQLHVFSAGMPSNLVTQTSESMNTYLSRFSSWRAQNNGKRTLAWQSCTGSVSDSPPCYDFTNDNAHMLTGGNFDNDVTGLAWVGTMCSASYSAGVSEGLLSASFVADTIAHEMGHNFGANHDSSGNTCPASGFIMAAIASTSSSGSIAWSSCSKTLITDKIQSSSYSCLANTPRAAFDSSTAACGDGFVNGNEQCDLGLNNGRAGSPCSSNCQRVGNVQCASGECCDLSTGRYKTSGSLCRQASNQCDFAEYCSGSSETCPGNHHKPDGSACSEAGPNSKCFNGVCVGLDAQCKKAWAGYTGTWVHGGRNGKPGSCKSGCGELKCTNTEWDNYCYTYNCPSGYVCTVGGQQINGPKSVDICSCLATQNTVTKVYVDDGTPCGTNNENVCKDRACVPRTASQSGQTSPACTQDSDCLGRGACSNAGECACFPGYHGSNCQNTYQCGVDCARLNRENCTSAASCGACLSGYTSSATTLEASTGCDLKQVTVAVATANSVKSGNNGSFAFDGNVYTYWASPYDNTTNLLIATQKNTTASLPQVVATPTVPVQIHRYDVIASNGLASQDPRAWVLEASIDRVRWVLLDEREDVFFSFRNERKSFIVKGSNVFNHFRFTVVHVRDPYSQGQTIELTQSSVDSGSSLTLNSTSSTTNGTKPTMQVAEIEFFTKTVIEPANPSLPARAVLSLATSRPTTAAGLTAFINLFIDDIARATGVSASRVVVLSVSASGSTSSVVFVDFELKALVGSSEPTPAAAVADLARQSLLSTSTLRNGNVTSTVNAAPIVFNMVTCSDGGVRPEGSCPSGDDSSSSSSATVIAASVSVVVVALIGILVGYFYFERKKRNAKLADDTALSNVVGVAKRTSAINLGPMAKRASAVPVRNSTATGFFTSAPVASRHPSMVPSKSARPSEFIARASTTGGFLNQTNSSSQPDLENTTSSPVHSHRREPSQTFEDKEWEEYVNEEGIPYYYNRATHESVWERPW